MANPNKETKRDEKYDGIEPVIRASNEIKINGRLIEEFECDGEFFVYVDGFLVQLTYIEAIRKAVNNLPLGCPF